MATVIEMRRGQRLGRLSPENALELESLTDTLFKAWIYPQLDDREKAEYVRGLSRTYLDFGLEAVMQAIDDLQQTEKQRPWISKIREQCEARHKTPAHHDAEYERWQADRRAHPENYIPIEMCIRDGNMLAAMKAKRRQEGRPMDAEDVRLAIRQLARTSAAEWAALVKAAAGGAQ